MEAKRHREKSKQTIFDTAKNRSKENYDVTDPEMVVTLLYYNVLVIQRTTYTY